MIQYIPSSLYGRLTLMLVVIQAVIVIVLESYVASIFLNSYSSLANSPAVGIPVYLMIFLFSQIFQVVLCWDAVVHQNTIQIIGFVFFNALSFAYSLFQYVQLQDALNFQAVKDVRSSSAIAPLLITVSVVLGVCMVVFAWLAFKLYLEFGWKIYKKIGADPRMKSMYRTYQIFIAILKLDFFFFLAFSVQFLVLVLNPNDPEFALTIVALPITLVVLFFAVYSLRQENKPVMGLFMIGCLLAMAYFIFKLARMYDPTQESKYIYTRKFLTFFAVLSLVAVTATLIVSILCALNFDQGLKNHISIQNNSANTRTQGGTEMSNADRKVETV